MRLSPSLLGLPLLLLLAACGGGSGSSGSSSATGSGGSSSPGTPPSWSTQTQLSGPSQAYLGDFTSDSDGDMAIAWIDGPPYHFRVRVFSHTADAWSDIQTITWDSGFFPSSMRIRGDASGDLALVWDTGQDSTGVGSMTLEYAYYDHGTGVWSAPNPIPTNSMNRINGSSSWDAALLKDSRLQILWGIGADEQAIRGQCWSILGTPATNTWDAPVDLGDPSDTTPFTYRVALFPAENGQCHALWTTHATADRILHRPWDPSSGWGTLSTVDDGSTEAGGESMAWRACVDGAGDLLVVRNLILAPGTATGTIPLASHRWNAASGTWGPFTELPVPTPEDTAYFDLVGNRSGQAMLCFTRQALGDGFGFLPYFPDSDAWGGCIQAPDPSSADQNITYLGWASGFLSSDGTFSFGWSQSLGGAPHLWHYTLAFPSLSSITLDSTPAPAGPQYVRSALAGGNIHFVYDGRDANAVNRIYELHHL